MRVIVRHQSPIRVVGETEVLAVLDTPSLAEPRRMFEVDGRPFEEDIAGGHWRSSHADIRAKAGELKRLADAVPDTKLLYFGMAEVPHTIAFGAYLGDERKIAVYDYDRDQDNWSWPLTDATLKCRIVGLPTEAVESPGVAVLRVAISYPILSTDVDEVIGTDRLVDVLVEPVVEGGPTPGLVRSVVDVDEVRQCVRKALGAIATHRPRVDTVHLFVAAPPSVCIAVGQELKLRNGPAIQTYQHRKRPGDRSLWPAIRLSAGSLGEVERPLSAEETELAAEVRVVFAETLREVIGYVAGKPSTGTGSAGLWLTALEPRAPLGDSRPFPLLPPLKALIQAGDEVAPEPRLEAYAFDKDPKRLWRLSDRLLVNLERAAGGDRGRLKELVRLFLFHEYLHDWQDLTKYTSEDVGSFANCLERIDYMADSYAIIHQMDFAVASGVVSATDEGGLQKYVVDQLSAVLMSFWAFEETPPPNYVWQERRLRRYLNWFWRRVQVREARTLVDALTLIGAPPAVEIAGLRYSTERGRIFVSLNEIRPGDTLEIGLLLENGAFDRRGSTTDMSIAELLEAVANHAHVDVERFFNSFFEHEKMTGAVLPS